MSVGDALVQAVTHASAGDAIASIDSALYQHLLLPQQMNEVFERLPRRLARLRQLVNAQSQSGLESLFRAAAADAGWRVDIQVQISRVGRVDILVDGWLVIELDGGEWHDEATARDEDSRRDAELILLGYRYHRFRYGQVLHQMPLCLAVVRAILADGRPRG
jgi:very-short-patch-repair endonuclease